MKRRVTILLCCLWLIVVVILVNLSQGSLIDQVPGFWLLSNTIESGSKFIALDSDSGQLYGLLELKGSENEKSSYRIVSVSEDGQALEATPVLKLTAEEEGSISDFTVSSDGFYVSVVSDTGELAELFFVDLENFSENNLPGQEAEALTLVAAQSLTAGTGRQINWAGYEDGAFVTWKDDGTGAEYYLSDLKKDADSMQLLMDAGQEASNQQFYLLCDFALLFVGFGFIYLAVCALYHKSYTIYMIALTETMLFVLAFGGAALMAWIRGKDALIEDAKFSQYYLEVFSQNHETEDFLNAQTQNIYSEQAYYDLWNGMLLFVQDDRTEGLFVDLCLTQTGDDTVLVSASGLNGISLSGLYDNGEEFLAWEFETGEGVSYTLTAVRDISGQVWFEDLFSQGYLPAALVLFVVLSLVCTGLLAGQGREIAKLSDAMLAASKGQEAVLKGRAKSTDVALMWNSFLELLKKINRISYTRYRIYESCYRFAPKDIEKIFLKDSITEVNGGDTVRLKGTLAFVTADEPERADEESAERMSRFVTLIEKNQEESGGFFVPGNSDLTSLRILFQEDNKYSVEFGTSLMNAFYAAPDLENMRAGVLLHYSDFLYAVAGNDQQCFPFLLSEEKSQMELFADWFRKMDLRLVITQEVKDREKPSESRYIGYLLLEKTQKKLELYEILSACSPVERRLKLDTEEKFSKSVRLFYQHDFYLARNGFSDVLKVNPFDQISKWYLFTCEKYLNQAYISGDICRLRPDA